MLQPYFTRCINCGHVYDYRLDDDCPKCSRAAIDAQYPDQAKTQFIGGRKMTSDEQEFADFAKAEQKAAPKLTRAQWSTLQMIADDKYIPGRGKAVVLDNLKRMGLWAWDMEGFGNRVLTDAGRAVLASRASQAGRSAV